MLRFAAVVACALVLAGCSPGMQYAIDTYRGIEVVPFAIDGDDVYRVFDKPAENKMMITPSLAKIAVIGAIRGATVYTVDTVPPQDHYIPAVLGFLASTGRNGCRIIEARLIQQPQYEFRYDCTPLPVQQPAPKPRRE